MNEPVSKGSRSGFVAIVGRPSAGKSTLLNTLCGAKVAIVSKVPQTTRNRIRGIVTREAGQLVFIDTPGFHESSRRFNRHMRGLIDETIRDSEVLLYVVDASRAPGDEELELVSTVSQHADLPRLIAINKVDVARAKTLEQVRLLLAQRLPDVPFVEVSALTGNGTDELLAALYELAPDGEPSYPDDFYTDQPPEFRVAEIIREKAMEGLREELPHSIYVDVLDLEVRGADPTAHADPESLATPAGGRGEDPQRQDPDRQDPDRENTLWIRAAIFVERSSQQGMLVGKGGAGIKRIRQSAQKELGKLFPYRIHLDLRVKTDENWRKNDRVLDRLVH